MDVTFTAFDFKPYYYHGKFGGKWTTNKGETEGGTMPPAHMVPKDLSLNMVKNETNHKT